MRDRYGRTRFGQACLLARRLIERGVRFVTVNMFETVFNEITWDIHGSAPFSPIECYKNEVGPNFDNAYTALLDDLYRTGLLRNTMVVAFGEFGRTPKINPAGGRDHHPGCWTGLFSGGPIQGGQAVGASDEIGSAPKDRPVSTGEIAATIFRGSASVSTRNWSGRKIGRFDSSTMGSSRSTSCSKDLMTCMEANRIDRLTSAPTRRRGWGSKLASLASMPGWVKRKSHRGSAGSR